MGHRNTRHLLFVMFMVYFHLAHFRNWVEAAKPVAELEESSRKGNEEEEKSAIASSMIGSRPPRCEGRCYSCGRCEAVQVPAFPQGRRGSNGDSAAKRLSDDAVTFSWRDDSNYKPMSWKCKCGDRILNP